MVSKTSKLVLDSSFEEMERLEPFVESLQKKVSFDEDMYSRILLTLSEAVNNAIVHGNQQDPAKKVVVQTQLEKDIIVMRVSDEGPGFDPTMLPNPLEEDNLLKEGGRGIYLIRQYADEVRFEEGGSEIIIAFHLTS